MLAVISGIAVGVACVVLQRVAGWNDLGTVLGLSNGLYLGPSVYAAWRMYAPVGVAPLTWVLTAGEGMLVGLLRGARRGDPDHGLRQHGVPAGGAHPPATVDHPAPDSG